MIDTARRSESDELAHQVGSLINQFWQRHFQEFCSVESWAPAINLYRFKSRLEICVDLAGIEPKSIDLQYEPGRLVIRGVRSAPQPPLGRQEDMCIEAMEINHGPFCRVVSLPDHVDLVRVQTQYTRGLLWVRLPFRDPG